MGDVDTYRLLKHYMQATLRVLPVSTFGYDDYLSLDFRGRNSGQAKGGTHRKCYRRKLASVARHGVPESGTWEQKRGLRKVLT